MTYFFEYWSARSSRPEAFLEKDVLKICSKFTGEHPCPSVISIKLLYNFIEITLRHGYSLVNLLHIFRTPIFKNTSGGLLLFIFNWKSWTYFHSEGCQNFWSFIEIPTKFYLYSLRNNFLMYLSLKSSIFSMITVTIERIKKNIDHWTIFWQANMGVRFENASKSSRMFCGNETASICIHDQKLLMA